MTTYETEQHKREEKAFANLMRELGWNLHELTQYYPFDFYAEKDDEGYFFEFKRRHHNFDTFNTTFFPAQKWARSRSWARELGCKFYLFIRWNDVIGYCDALTITPAISFAGRQDRGTYEPMVKIPTSAFRLLRPNCDQVNGY